MIAEPGSHTARRTELSGAHGREISWVREQDTPAVTEILMQINCTVLGFTLDVWECVADGKRHFRVVYRVAKL